MTWTAAERRAKTAERIAASRCVSCKRPVLPGEGKRCPKCERVATKARRRWTKSEAGQAWNREYAAARYADRKARGVYAGPIYTAGIRTGEVKLVPRR